jgi:hypothetical protein
MPKQNNRDYPLSATPNVAKTNVYRATPPSRSFQDSVSAYNITRDPKFKPKGKNRTFVEAIPTSSIKVKSK